MDPAGILMLRSVRIVFEKIGVQPESMKFVPEKFDFDGLVKALTEQPEKCPAVYAESAADRSYYEETGETTTGETIGHIMVATNALKGSAFMDEDRQYIDGLRNQWFVNCKNSYRDDQNEPGMFRKRNK